MPFHNIFQKSEERKKAEKFKIKTKIIADSHEKISLVASELIGLGVDVEFKHLKVADYLVGNVAIERKTVSDFISSMLNKRLLIQLEEIKQYEKRLLVIEGTEEQELYNDDDNEEKKGLHSNAIRGMLLYISLEASCPIIFSKNYQDTAKFLYLIARRQEKNKTPRSLHAKKKNLNFQEQKQYILESFPNIGPTTAKKLLEKFKTINKIFSASEEELKEVLKSRTEH